MWKQLSENCGDEFAVLIPAFEPDTRLVSLIATLLEKGVSHVIVVDDGSAQERSHIFDALRTMPSVHVLRHPRNRGQGRSVKSGLEFALTQLPTVSGVVTADADGQHIIDDILLVAETLRRTGSFVLGSRRFDQDVPARSQLGNTLTRWVFRILSGHDVYDTQSGLRGFPRQHLRELVSIPGERFEYNMNVLTHFCRAGSPPLEVPITTVYIEGNRSSHFKPIRDSLRIYSGLLRYAVRTALRKQPLSVD
jgi:glycosyltransferase involved in cell wall biosynthesis